MGQLNGEQSAKRAACKYNEMELLVLGNKQQYRIDNKTGKERCVWLRKRNRGERRYNGFMKI